MGSLRVYVHTPCGGAETKLGTSVCWCLRLTYTHQSLAPQDASYIVTGRVIFWPAGKIATVNGVWLYLVHGSVFDQGCMELCVGIPPLRAATRGAIVTQFSQSWCRY